MPTPITMPQLGESVTEGEVARWLKEEGDRVERDEPLLEIVTDKVNDQMPSPISGTLVKIVAPAGTTVPVGAEIAQIEVDSRVPVGAGAPSGASGEGDVRTSLRVPHGEAPAADDEMGDGAEERRRYTPVVKRLAQEHNIDLSAIDGTGLSGRVTKNDVLAYIAERQSGAASPTPAPAIEPTLTPLVAASPPAAAAEPVLPPLEASAPEALPAATPVPFAPMPAPLSTSPTVPSRAAPAASADEEYVPLTAMRRAIAEHMVRSKHAAPHATTTIEVDMTRLVRWRQAHKEEMRARHGVDITFVPLVIAAVVQALRAFPIMNSSWGEDHITLKRRINIGVAVGLEDGLVVPVIHAADEKNIVGLARAVAALAQRARENRLTTADVQGGTFTVNNTGVFGAIVTTPVINQPQAAILAMNAIIKRPVVIEDDAIAVRSIMNLSLSFDHRIVDGLTAGRFMQQVVEHIDRLDVSTL